MSWWFGTTVAAIIMYAVLSALEAYRCPILLAKEKFILISFSLLTSFCA